MTTCSPALYEHAFREPAPTLISGVPSWSTTWDSALPEPEPEVRFGGQQTHDADAMATEDELPCLSIGEMDGMMDFLPELELGDETCEELVQPWTPSATQTMQDMDSPSVFRCDSPGMLSPSTSATAPSKSTAQAPAQPHKLRKRVTFGACNRVRTIPAVSNGVEVKFAFGVGPADTDECLKTNDGPSRSSAMMDLLLRAYFERGATTTEYMQHVLGADNCAAISAHASELAELCSHLADQIDSMPEGGVVGVLPSNSRLGAAHVPGIRTLAQWMCSC